MGAEAEAGEVRFGNASPEAAFAVECDDVVVVAHGFEIHHERRMAVDAQGGSGDEGAFEAVSPALAEDALRGTRGIGVVVFDGVDEPLDVRGSLEAAQGSEVRGR
jgi:hypothetical protein